MRLVLIGATKFGLRCLELAHGLSCCSLVGIVTARRKFPISYRAEGVINVMHADVPGFASEHSLDCKTIEQGMNDPGLLETVTAWNPDAFLVVGWYHMIPKSWRKIAPAYGLHASLLPDYSGGAPLVWAMINGETKTGITMFQMDDGVDSGPIVGQAEEPIHPDDTIATLYARIEERGLELLVSALPRLADGSATLQPQPLQGRQVMPQRSPEDGRIDWRKSSQVVDRFVRAQTKPYPGAFTIHKSDRLIIWAARCSNQEAPQLGEGNVLHNNEACSVVCGDGMLRLDEIEIKGHSFVGKQILSVLPPMSLLESPAKMMP